MSHNKKDKKEKGVDPFLKTDSNSPRMTRMTRILFIRANVRLTLALIMHAYGMTKARKSVDWPR
jgi:hypothetical protein